MIKHFLLSILLLSTYLITNLSLAPSQAKSVGHGYDFEGNGKRGRPCFSSVYTQDNLTLPAKEQVISTPFDTLQKALKRQVLPLNKNANKRWQKAGLKISARSQLKQTHALLTHKKRLQVKDLTAHYKPYLIRGEDGCGNTQFTGYFSPVLQVKSKPDKIYKYPLYKRPRLWPRGKALTRAQIIQGGLDGRGLELAYSKSLLDNYFLQVQGSGLAEYIDTGERITLQYGGQNGLKYRSLGRYLVDNQYVAAENISLDAIRNFFQKHPDKMVPFLNINPSFVFFNKRKQGPTGSLNTEVVSEVSVAVDPAFIPLGSVLLAEIPKLDAAGRFLKHELRILVAQDTGGAIRGTGHVDIYMGAGQKAQNKASHLHHYGRLWLLLPRP